MKRWHPLLMALILGAPAISSNVRGASAPSPGTTRPASIVTYPLENSRIQTCVGFEDGVLLFDRLAVRPQWASEHRAAAIETDADFALDVMYTDWSAPGKVHNADNPVVLTKKDFALVHQKMDTLDTGTRELTFDFKGTETTIALRVTYRLEPDAFYVRRNIAVSDTVFGHHFLRFVWPRRGTVSGVSTVVKDGGFGQPVAVLVRGGGAFFGLEYPPSENRIERQNGGMYDMRCGQEFGELIGKGWLQSDWVVVGITPDSHVKRWFFRYLDDIRVAPLRPYSLYNTWYDLRSPVYPHWSAENVMSEKTCLKMAGILRTSMIEKHGIALDAFVLDDGWDVYGSDWLLRTEQWPHGLKPLADELEKTNTSLGMWFGPTGGYSFHKERVGWMKAHGYEVVGDQMCVAGTNYRALLTKRVVDFVVNDGVGYYKWDGIQFSCSEPDHGHPIDIYSRRAVMESVAGMCRAVREKNPGIFLNITSGTWLSPWWVKYANAIWMQGMDYGFADVPSISERDAAITYRDFILYDDLRRQDCWFPIANLMTHGIIKGKHESVGDVREPLDKFTDDVLLYFARGVSMYELYVSPDILTEGEWASISQSMAWARDRFPILMNTEMVGGNPLNGEAYGYAHFRGSRGILAARNPVIEATALDIELAPSQGLDPAASALVLEKVYPTRWISPKLYRAGDRIRLALDGCETAVYEVYPLEEARVPLVAGVTFDVISNTDLEYSISFHGPSPGARLLNPARVKSIAVDGRNMDAARLTFRTERPVEMVTGHIVRREPSDGSAFSVRCNLPQTSAEATLAILLSPAEATKPPSRPTLSATCDGREAAIRTEPQEGTSQWYTMGVQPGVHEVIVRVSPGTGDTQWRGSAFIWMIAQERCAGKEISFVLEDPAASKPMPPHPWHPGEIRRSVKLGEMKLECASSP